MSRLAQYLVVLSHWVEQDRGTFRGPDELAILRSARETAMLIIAGLY